MDIELEAFRTSLESKDPVQILATFLSIIETLTEFSRNELLKNSKITQDEANLNNAISLQKDVEKLLLEIYEIIKDGNLENIETQISQIDTNLQTILNIFANLQNKI